MGKVHAAWLVVAMSAFWLVPAGAALAQEAPGDPVHGGELFVENCAVCHGVNGQGRIGASLESFPGIDPRSEIEATVAAGIPGSVMPAWSRAKGGPLTDQDIRDIAAYVLAAFGGTQPIAPLPTYVPPAIPALPHVAGDPSAGAVVYHENCTMCHGDRGQGRFGLPLAKAWPVTDPPTYIQQVVRQGISGTVMPAWASVNGGPLTDKQIADVAAFVLTLTPAAAPTPAPPSPGPMGTAATLLLLAAIVAVVVVILVVYFRRSRAV
jgi:mono/diheme cytochrome c family protein